MWWVSHNDHGAYTARGIHGQAIYVDPAAEMVIVRFASTRSRATSTWIRRRFRPTTRSPRYSWGNASAATLRGEVSAAAGWVGRR